MAELSTVVLFEDKEIKDILVAKARKLRSGDTTGAARVELDVDLGKPTEPKCSARVVFDRQTKTIEPE